MKQEKKSFILYNSYADSFRRLSMEDRGELITAIFAYVETGEEPLWLSPAVSMAFSFIRSSLDRDREAYEETCQKRAESGKKGGRPRKRSLDDFIF